ncbi:DNA polymerase III subunit gamma/tau [Thermovirga sp.]|uniref:DNA polymerase III subunit gamma/tau n=1 Tax=Thermovirga sp. TaxID=2699834 RepID=UPI0025E0CECC|nr:DNA polymerase III subunit gamma/tau [Thermovirga sp.]MBO8153995.1 DNA polymerase III subunit gamma/tau [Thermovirga sp.]
MSHITLYRKYRPKNFSQVIGQSTVVQVVKNKILSGKIPHAFLFSGPRGSGKTTVARLLAKAVNCTNLSKEGEPCGECGSCRAITEGSSLDVIEIDGASHRGIDNIRELKEHVSLAPFSSPYKVYIIDEVHMVTTDGFNALLKTLEEPPSYVIFVLATTEPRKVPVTIRSRCQHIPFHRIGSQDIVSCLKNVLSLEGVEVQDDALWEIAREADGSLRDALSILEQALAFLEEGKGLTLDSMNPLLGGGSRKDMERLMANLRTDRGKAFFLLQQLLDVGLTSKRLFEGLYEIARDLWIFNKWGENSGDLLAVSKEEKSFLKEESPFWKPDHLWKIMKFCVENMPRANLGMRSDVASGLVLGFFEEFGSAEEIKPQEKTFKREQREHKKQEEPKTISPGKEIRVPDKNSWDKFLLCFYPDNILIYCALACAEPIYRDGDIEVVFHPDHEVAFELLRSPRNLRKLKDIAKSFWQGSRILLRSKDHILDLGEDFQLENDSEKTYVSAQIEVRENKNENVEKRVDRHREADREKKGNVSRPYNKENANKNKKGFQDKNLKKLMQLVDGEILLVKDEEILEAQQESGEELENE